MIRTLLACLLLLVAACKRDKLIDTPPCEPHAEVCNGRDDDCDELIDEGTDVECSNSCGSGIQACVAGALMPCDARMPVQETCNGQDDDCNGPVDDSLPISVCYERGLDDETLRHGCTPGVSFCEGGSMVCKGQKLPKLETCNGLDDDCDGQIDEDLDCKPPVDIAVVLTWDIPNDVDLHLRNSTASQGSHSKLGWSNYPFDCYYASKNPLWGSTEDMLDDPHLDRDDTQDIGAETITVARIDRYEIYTVGAFLFSWKSKPERVTATVKIYCGGELKTTLSRTLDNYRDMWVVGTIRHSPTLGCDFSPDGFVLNIPE